MISRNSPAKINLTLDILEEDSSGYHKIQTIFQRIDIHDVVSIQKHNSDFVFTSTRADLIDKTNNTITKAHKLLEKHFQTQLNVEVELEKNIPVGSGLGGGSSNAATFMMIMKELFHLQATDEQWLDIGKQIGMDVPFFLSNASMALGTHYGEVITPLTNQPQSHQITIFIPPFSISSKEAYDSINITTCGREKELTDKLVENVKTGTQKDIGDYIHNDFELWIYEKYAEFSQIAKQLRTEYNISVHVSGSGSSIFFMENIENTPKISDLLSQKKFAICDANFL